MARNVRSSAWFNKNADHYSTCSCGKVGALMPRAERAESLPYAARGDSTFFFCRDVGSKSAAVFAIASPQSLNSQIEKRFYQPIYLLFLPVMARKDRPCS